MPTCKTRFSKLVVVIADTLTNKTKTILHHVFGEDAHIVQTDPEKYKTRESLIAKLKEDCFTFVDYHHVDHEGVVVRLLATGDEFGLVQDHGGIILYNTTKRNCILHVNSVHNPLEELRNAGRV